MDASSRGSRAGSRSRCRRTLPDPIRQARNPFPPALALEAAPEEGRRPVRADGTAVRVSKLGGAVSRIGKHSSALAVTVAHCNRYRTCRSRPGRAALDAVAQHLAPGRICFDDLASTYSFGASASRHLFPGFCFQAFVLALRTSKRHAVQPPPDCRAGPLPRMLSFLRIHQEFP